jgi:hypothetical protein
MNERFSAKRRVLGVSFYFLFFIAYIKNLELGAGGSHM